MNKLVASILVTSTLIAAAGIAIAGPPADIGFDPNRMFFRYQAPGVDSGDFQVVPENRYNPIVLPCDVQVFGGQNDIDYLGTGPTVFPHLTATFFNGQNQIVSKGCTGLQLFSDEGGFFYAMTAGSMQRNGYYAISSGYGCVTLFQPSDLPADTVVRMHLQLSAYLDNTGQGSAIADPNPANNGHDIYVRRSCACQ